jgi:tetratricopeptide (TPR) repeat protein
LRVLELEPAKELEAQLERGHLLAKLGRLGDAQKTFEALAAAHPNDARPQTGLGVVAMQRDFDLADVTRRVRAARKLANHDRLYYEVALGTVPPTSMGEVMTQLAQAPDAPLTDLDARFDEVLELARGYRAHDPARAALIELLFTLAREAVPKILANQHGPALAVARKLPDKAMALTRKFPESRDAWRLVFASSRLAADGRKARLLANAPLPASLQQDPDLRVQQVRAQLDAALMWEDRELLLTAVKSARSLPAEVDADTAALIRATADAIAGREGDKASLQRAVDAFAALGGRKTGKEQALALNNAALAVAYSGDIPAAMSILERAAQADEEAVTALYNMSALAYRTQAHEGLPEVFAKVASASTITGVRLHSRAFLVTLADDGLGDAAVTREEFAASLASEENQEFRGRLPLGRWGVVEQGEFKVSLGYSSTQGLVVLDEVVSRWWLMLPAPAMDSLLAARAKGTKPAKGEKQAKPAKP